MKKSTRLRLNSFQPDANYSRDEARDALKLVYNYLEQSRIINQDLMNKLNTIKGAIEQAKINRT